MPRSDGALRVEPVYTGIANLPTSGVADGTVARVRQAAGLPAFRAAFNATSGLWEPEGVGKLWEATGSGLTTGVSGISQLFTHLRLVYTARTAAASGSNSGIRIRFNGLATSYAWEVNGRYWNGTADTAYAGSSSAQTSWLVGLIASPGANSNYVGKGSVELPFYTRSDMIRSVHGVSDWHDGTNTGGMQFAGTQYGSTAALTSLTFIEDSGSGFAANSRATLYGIP